MRTYTSGGSWESASPWGSSMFQCSVKRKGNIKNPLSLRDRCAHRSWQSASPLRRTKRYCHRKRRTDSHVASLLGMTGYFNLLFLLPSAHVSPPSTPSALRATVSLPRRRCTTLEGAALRGKDSALALRGAPHKTTTPACRRQAGVNSIHFNPVFPNYLPMFI